MNNQTICDSITCAYAMAGDGDYAETDGLLPRLVSAPLFAYLRTSSIEKEESNSAPRYAATINCHRIEWREFLARKEELQVLADAWEAATRALSEGKPPWAKDDIPDQKSRTLDQTTRALSVLMNEELSGSMLVIDSGPLVFRWAALPIGAARFDIVVVTALYPDGDLVPGAADDTPIIETHQPQSLLAVTADMEAARVARHLSGVPSVSLPSVLNLAKTRTENAPHLTIVIPTLGETGLAETLQSIANQQRHSSVEVLILHSSRHCADAQLERWKQYQSPGLSIVEMAIADRSPYEAMNAGLTLASSTWIYFMGCGDTLTGPEVLATLQAAFEECEPDCGMIYGSVRMKGDGPGAQDGEIYAGEFTYDRLREQNICHQAIVYRLSTLRRQGGFDGRYPVNADWAVNLRGWEGLKPRYIDLVLANFVRGGLSSTQWDTEFFNDLDRLWTENRPQPIAE
ncbi:MAG: glycosyltransferase [Pseudomonadota bacterium]